MGTRLYCASGMVRIASVLPQVMHETDQNRPMAMFDGFMQSQREMMLSREMIVAALADETWQTSDSGVHPPSEERFAIGLKVEVRPRSDYLRVTFTSPDPAVAVGAVRSVISAYQRAFVADQDRREKQRTGQLKTRRETLEAELQGIQAQIASVADGHSAGELDALGAVASDRFKKLSGALADIESAIAGGVDPASKIASRSPGEIAADESLRFWTAEQARVESQLAKLLGQGFGSEHPAVVQLYAAAQTCRDHITRFTDILEQCRAAPAASTGASPLEHEANLKKLAADAEEDVKRLSNQRAQLKALEERAGVVRQSLNETNSRLDALETEASVGGRLTVLNSGDKPMTAILDDRDRTALAGAVLCVAATLLGLVVTSLRRGRYRFADEVATDFRGRIPLVVPVPGVDERPSSSAGANSVGAAPMCVHDLRIRLHGADASRSRTYLITSVCEGEGKTSLSVALALSFAAAGFRTLLIDFDPKTRRLTRGFDFDHVPGLSEAAASGGVFARPVLDNLFVMGAGHRHPRDSWKMSPEATAKVLSAAQEQFDVVIVDTDPILSGLHSPVIAAQVGGVILNVDRGRKRVAVENAVRRLELLGAPIAGVVFNRADAGEFPAVTGGQAAPAGVGCGTPALNLNQFGPLVVAMLQSLTHVRGSTEKAPSPALSLMKDVQAGQAA